MKGRQNGQGRAETGLVELGSEVATVINRHREKLSKHSGKHGPPAARQMLICVDGVSIWGDLWSADSDWFPDWSRLSLQKFHSSWLPAQASNSDNIRRRKKSLNSEDFFFFSFCIYSISFIYLINYTLLRSWGLRVIFARINTETPLPLLKIDKMITKKELIQSLKLG